MKIYKLVLYHLEFTWIRCNPILFLIILNYITKQKEELKPGHMQMEKWSILSYVVKDMQFNQYLIGHYELKV